ncbi:hypothetical protein D3C78_326800 [compost metagenome]
MAGVQRRRHAGPFEHAPQQADQAVAVERCVAQVAPAVELAKHRAVGNARHFEPLQVGCDRAQRLECRGAVLHAERFTVTFAARQEQADTHAGFGLDVLHAQARQFVTAKPTPEAQQQQCSVTPGAAQCWQVMLLAGQPGLFFKTLDSRLQVLQQQRCGLFRRRRVQGADTAQYLAYQRCLGRVGKTLADVPLAEGRKALAQGADRMLPGVIGQVAGNAVGSGREKPAPVGFEMLDGSLITAPGVVTGGGAEVALDVGHVRGCQRVLPTQ